MDAPFKIHFRVDSSNLLDYCGGIFRAWWFEPFVATFSFTFAIHVYWYEERKRGLSRENRILDTFFVYNVHTSDLWNSLGAYWIGICILKWIRMIYIESESPVVIPDGFPTDLDSCVYLILEVVAGILMYDAIFFAIHWAMHAIPRLRGLHSRHHSDAASIVESNLDKDKIWDNNTSASLEARDVLRHSIVDGSLQVLCNVLVQQLNPWPDGGRKSRLARVLHNAIVTWMLTESHTVSPTPNIFRRFFVGVREHRYHHLSSTNF